MCRVELTPCTSTPVLAHLCASCSLYVQKRYSLVCFLFAIPHCGKQLQARGLRYSRNIPRCPFFMTQHPCPAWKVTGHGVPLWCFGPHLQDIEMPLANQKKKKICVCVFFFFKNGKKMCYRHKHLCDPRTALIWCVDLTNIAPSHLVELGGSRAVMPLPEMERKRLLLLYLFLFSSNELRLLSIKHLVF